MDSNDPERTPVPHRKFYEACRDTARVLLALCILSLVLSVFPSPSLIKRLEQFLKVLFQPDAMAETVMLVGLPGAISALLIPRMLDRVCGVQISELVHDSYPDFSLNFGAFMCLAIAGVLLGKAGFFWPTFYAFLGVFIAFAGLCRVCFALMIHPASQNELVLSYFERQFHACQQDRSRSGQEDYYKLRQLFQNTAEYARTLLLQDHQDRTLEIARLWLDVFSGKESLAQWSTHLSGADDPIFQDIALCSSAWTALFPEGLSAPQNAGIFYNMLEHLDRAVPADNSSKRYSYGRTVLLLGLAQFLTEISHDISDQDAKRLCALTYGRQNHLADQDLTCACLMIRTVEWLDGSSSAREDLARAVPLLQSMIDRSLLTKRANLMQVPDSSLPYFLYCAELMTCYRLCMNSDEFFLLAAEMLDASPETVGMSAYLAAKEQRTALLNCLLRQVSMKKDAASAGHPKPAKESAQASEAPDRPTISPQPVQEAQDKPWPRFYVIPSESPPRQEVRVAMTTEPSQEREV